MAIKNQGQLQACIGIYAQVYHHLVECLLKKSMRSLTNKGWSSDDKDVFDTYRTNVANTVMHVHGILRDELLKLLNQHLDEAMKLCADPAGHANNWPYLESCLYNWSSIGEPLAAETENQHLMQFLGKLPTIPFHGHHDVITAMLDSLGGFAKWLSAYPSLVASLVPIITSAMSTSALARSATMALKGLSRDCTQALEPCSKEIVQACAHALNSNQLKQEECIRLMYPLGKMLGFLPPTDMNTELQGVMRPYIAELQAMSAKGQAGPNDRGQALYSLKVVYTLFQALDGSGKTAAEAQQAERMNFISGTIHYGKI